MKEIYSRLLNGAGSRRVKSDTSSNVSTNITTGGLTVKVTSVYKFVGNSNIQKAVINLLNQTQSQVTLTKLEIVRTISPKNVKFAIRFLNDDDVLIYEETDVTLSSKPDSNLLKGMNLELV